MRVASSASADFCQLSISQRPTDIAVRPRLSVHDSEDRFEGSAKRQFGAADAALGGLLGGGTAEKLPIEVWTRIVSSLPFHDKLTLQRTSKSFADLVKCDEVNSHSELAARRSNELLNALKAVNGDQAAIQRQQRLRDSLFRFEHIHAKWLDHDDAGIPAPARAQYAEIANLLGPELEFEKLPILETARVKIATVGRGWYNGLYDIDLSNPVMRGFQQDAEQPFVAIRVKWARWDEHDEEQWDLYWRYGTVVLCPEHCNKPEWIMESRFSEPGGLYVKQSDLSGPDVKIRIKKLLCGDLVRGLSWDEDWIFQLG